MKRSSFLKASLLTVTLPSLDWQSAQPKKVVTRFAHLTDIHVKPETTAEAGMAKALQHVQRLTPKIDFIVNGGDAIMDALAADKASTKAQWNVFHNSLKNNNSLPVHHCIGNHDIWGWFLKNDNVSGDASYGKKWVVEELSLPNRYYTFQKNKWHFIVLDSTQLNPAGGYIAKLDEEQLVWFKQTLESIPQDDYICLISHIPILSICAGLFFNKTEENGDLLIKRNLMHTDFLSLKNIFLEHSNIKVCISGHIHMQDELNYMGVKFYCNGAVCGNWWKGSFNDFAPGYAVMELFDDGSSHRTMNYYS